MAVTKKYMQLNQARKLKLAPINITTSTIIPYAPLDNLVDAVQGHENLQLTLESKNAKFPIPADTDQATQDIRRQEIRMEVDAYMSRFPTAPILQAPALILSICPPSAVLEPLNHLSQSDRRSDQISKPCLKAQFYNSGSVTVSQSPHSKQAADIALLLQSLLPPNQNKSSTVTVSNTQKNQILKPTPNLKNCNKNSTALILGCRPSPYPQYVLNRLSVLKLFSDIPLLEDIGTADIEQVEFFNDSTLSSARLWQSSGVVRNLIWEAKDQLLALSFLILVGPINAINEQPKMGLWIEAASKELAKISTVNNSEQPRLKCICNCGSRS
ncbi:uncharacterized protein [Ambystoma mexicanum]|uniref:uncharacterized protein n=1 Tax=Ambystoma mexicanum TaxID=8296 RepID=UPI0037E8759B